MSTQIQNRLPGFATPVHDAQTTFRAVLEAMSRPTLPQPLPAVQEGSLRTPGPLGAAAGAVLLALCDEQTPLWLSPSLRAAGEVAAWLRFHTGARVTGTAAEALVVVAASPDEAPRLADLARGTDEEPHLSATLLIDAAGEDALCPLLASGPGVDGTITWDGAGLTTGLLTERSAGAALFPRGVDLIIVDAAHVRALPRTTVLHEAEAPAQQVQAAPGHASAAVPEPAGRPHRTHSKEDH